MALAWLLSGCSTALPMVAEKVAQITELVMAREEPLAGNELLNRAGEAAAEGRYAEAETYLDAALSVDPYEDQALRQMAIIYRLTGRPDKARRYEKLAREVDVVDVGVWDVVEDATPATDAHNNIHRFTVLNKILDVGLISALEHDERREANLGALLPLTQPPPALIPGRAPPRAGDVIERLQAISQFNKVGALKDRAYALERNVILEGLLPLPKSEHRTTAVTAPEGLDLETHQQALDRLLDTKLISPREHKQESAVLVGLISPAAGVMGEADSAPKVNLSMQDKPLAYEEDTLSLEQAVARMPAPAPAKAAVEPEAARQQDTEIQISALATGTAALPEGAPALEPLADSITRINIHLALSRTPEIAKRSWHELQQANSLTLVGLIPRVSRVDLGGGKGVFFQLSAGPIADMEAAVALCDELLSRNYYCAPLVF